MGGVKCFSRPSSDGLHTSYVGLLFKGMEETGLKTQAEVIF